MGRDASKHDGVRRGVSGHDWGAVSVVRGSHLARGGRPPVPSPLYPGERARVRGGTSSCPRWRRALGMPGISTSPPGRGRRLRRVRANVELPTSMDGAEGKVACCNRSHFRLPSGASTAPTDVRPHPLRSSDLSRGERRNCPSFRSPRTIEANSTFDPSTQPSPPSTGERGPEATHGPSRFGPPTLAPSPSAPPRRCPAPPAPSPPRRRRPAPTAPPCRPPTPSGRRSSRSPWPTCRA